MTGLELAQWIIKLDPSLAIILLSAEADKKMVTDSLKIGVYDFLEKPIVLNAVREAVQKAISQTHSNRSLQDKKSQVDQVQQFHHSILGIHHTEKMKRITFRYFPMHEVGGDFINVYPLTDQRFMIMATDVSGHDLKAAFVSAFFQGVTRGMIEKGASIQEIYSFTNEFLIQEWGKHTPGIAMSLSTCAAMIDLNAKTCLVTNQGFPRPFYVTDCGKITPLSEGGVPLGWFTDTEQLTQEFICDKGGGIYFWSDGLDDTASRMELNTFAVLYRILSSEEGLQAVKNQAVDDLMIVRFAMCPDQDLKVDVSEQWIPFYFTDCAGSDYVKIDAMQEDWKKTISYLFPAVAEEKIYDILLSTREAYLNSLIHGAQKEMTKRALLQISYHQKSQAIRVRIDDPGEGHGLNLADSMEVLEAQLKDTYSGLTMMKFLCQNIRNERNGATVIMDFSLSPQ